jgi:hypothetical protein
MASDCRSGIQEMSTPTTPAKSFVVRVHLYNNNGESAQKLVYYIM